MVAGLGLELIKKLEIKCLFCCQSGLRIEFQESFDERIELRTH